jgi:hypothetical protein
VVWCLILVSKLLPPIFCCAAAVAAAVKRWTVMPAIEGTIMTRDSVPPSLSRACERSDLTTEDEILPSVLLSTLVYLAEWFTVIYPSHGSPILCPAAILK